MRLARGLAGLITVVLLLSGTGVASAHNTWFSEGVATVAGSGSTALNEFSLSVSEKNGDPHNVAGYIRARTKAPGGFNFQGPPICVDVRGNTAGIVQKLGPGTVPASAVGMVVYITGIDNGPGHDDYAGFTGVAPAAAFPTCAPNPALAQLKVNGDVVVHDA